MSFLCKKSKCHKKALEVLWLPPAARNVSGMSGHNKHREGHWFCLSACSASKKLGVVWRRLKLVQIGTETAVEFRGGREYNKLVLSSWIQTELRVSGRFMERTVKKWACRTVCCYLSRLRLQRVFLTKPGSAHIPAGKRQHRQPPSLWRTARGCSGLRPGRPRLGTTISAPPLQLLGGFGVEQHAEQLRKDPGAGSDLSTQCGCAKDTSAAAQQGLTETFLRKINYSALADCPRGVAAGRDGGKGGGGGLGSPALLRVGLLPVRWTPLPPSHCQPFPDQMHINYTEQLKP